MNNIYIKKTISHFLSMTRILDIIEKLVLSNKAFVLMYHRVLNPKDTKKGYIQPGMYVFADSFEIQIAFLRDRFKVVFLEELVEKVHNGEEIGGMCAITFDDGWRDNFTHAFPLLKKYRLPASIFLATGFIGTDKVLWSEEICSYLVLSLVENLLLKDPPPSFVRLKNAVGGYFNRRDDVFLDRSIEVLKTFSRCEREELLAYFRSLFNSEMNPRQMLSWDEAKEMFSSGLVRFGSHTVNHEILDQTPFDEIMNEISHSREEIQSHLGCSVGMFAYPNGNHNESIQAILAENGFTAAMTTRRGFLTQGISLMEIPRIGIHEDVSNSIPMFISRILLT